MQNNWRYLLYAKVDSKNYAFHDLYHSYFTFLDFWCGAILHILFHLKLAIIALFSLLFAVCLMGCANASRAEVFTIMAG
jgi:hypothetical protein